MRLMACLGVLAIGAVVCRAGEEPPKPDVGPLAREFLAQIGLLSPKTKEARAAQAAEIKKLSPEAAPEKWTETLGAKQKDLVRKIETHLKGAAPAAAAARTGELDARRKTALDFITGKGYGSKDSQKKVDELVGKAREVWENPYALEAAESEALKKILEDLREVEGYLALYPGAGVPAAHDLKPVAAAFNEAVRAAWIKPEWVKIMQYNEQQAFMDAEEKTCVKVLNEYRMMLGRNPLETDARMVSASRGHARDMLEKKFFSHDSPVPGKRTPGDRLKLEGYTAWAGENIYMGSPSGADAFRAWYHSSGHHKNMVGASKQIGVGRAERHWCQNFGNDGPFATRADGKPPAVLLYERLLALAKDAGAKERLDLAQYAYANKLWAPAKQQLDAVLKLEPDNITAKRILSLVEAELAKGAPKRGP